METVLIPAVYLALGFVTACVMGRLFQREVDSGLKPKSFEFQSALEFGVCWGVLWPIVWVTGIVAVVIYVLKIIGVGLRWAITGKRS